MQSSIRDLIQYVTTSTSLPPLTFFYRKIYNLSVMVATLLLKRVKGVSAIYLRRGAAKGEIVYGLSDIDLLVIVNDQEEQASKEKVRATYNRLSNLIPLFGS